MQDTAKLIYMSQLLYTQLVSPHLLHKLLDHQLGCPLVKAIKGFVVM